MPTNITDSDAFTDPCTRPAGADVRNSASVQAPFQALANRTRFLANQLGGAAGTSEWAFRVVKTRTLLVPLWPSFGAWSISTDWTSAQQLESDDVHEKHFFPLNAHLRDGWSIDNIRVLCKPAVAEATAGDRMSAQLWAKTPNYGTPAAPVPASIGSSQTDDATNNVQSLQLTYGPSIAVVKNGNGTAKEYFLVVTSSRNIGDLIYSVQMTVASPGPREV